MDIPKHPAPITTILSSSLTVMEVWYKPVRNIRTELTGQGPALPACTFKVTPLSKHIEMYIIGYTSISTQSPPSQGGDTEKRRSTPPFSAWGRRRSSTHRTCGAENYEAVTQVQSCCRCDTLRYGMQPTRPRDCSRTRWAADYGAGRRVVTARGQRIAKQTGRRILRVTQVAACTVDMGHTSPCGNVSTPSTATAKLVSAVVYIPGLGDGHRSARRSYNMTWDNRIASDGNTLSCAYYGSESQAPRVEILKLQCCTCGLHLQV